jgi:integrase
MSFPAHQDTTREHAYKALTSFAKYLQHKGIITPAQLVELKTIRPRRRKDPQRSIPVEEEVQQLLHEARHSKHWAMIALMVHAGLRAHEVAQLSWKDINLDNQVIVVQGKGGKRRFVGMNTALLEALKAHQAVANPHEVPLLFYDTKGKPLTGDGVWKRVNTLSKRGGFHTSPHALRRYFATTAAMSGRSLVTLQRVLGHSNLSTTEQYIRATSLQAAEEMKGWD